MFLHQSTRLDGRIALVPIINIFLYTTKRIGLCKLSILQGANKGGKIMKTIILCGGLGYRLKEETEFKPKPMVLIGGKPTWHIMKIYAHWGITILSLLWVIKAMLSKNIFSIRIFCERFTLDTKEGRTKFTKTEIVRMRIFISILWILVKILYQASGYCASDYIPASDEHFMVTYGDGVADIDIKTHHSTKVRNGGNYHRGAST